MPSNVTKQKRNNCVGEHIFIFKIYFIVCSKTYLQTRNSPKSISIVNKFRLSIWIFAHFCCLPGDIWLPLFTGYFFSFLQATVRFLNRCNIIWKCAHHACTHLYTLPLLDIQMSMSIFPLPPQIPMYADMKLHCKKLNMTTIICAYNLCVQSEQDPHMHRHR